MVFFDRLHSFLLIFRCNKKSSPSTSLIESSGCVFRSIAASVTRRRLTSPRHFTLPLKLMLVAVFDRPARRHLITAPSTRRSTIGDRAFPAAAACAWNSLPSSVRTVSSLNAFPDETAKKQRCSTHHSNVWTKLQTLTLITDICNMCSCSVSLIQSFIHSFIHVCMLYRFRNYHLFVNTSTDDLEKYFRSNAAVEVIVHSGERCN